MKRFITLLTMSLTLLPGLTWALGTIEIPVAVVPITGVSVVSGWYCVPPGLTPDQVRLTAGFGSETPNLPVQYGFPRPDTAQVCNQADPATALNGFFSFWNYNILPVGTSEITVRVETLPSASTSAGPKVIEELGPTSFEVVHLGEQFLVGLPTPVVTVENWPAQGERVQLKWQQALQDWAIVGLGEDNASGQWVMDLTQIPNSASGNPPGQTPVVCDPPIHMSMDTLRAVVDLEQETTAQMMAGLSGNLHLGSPRQDAQMRTELTGNYVYDPAGGPMDGDFSLNTQSPAFYDLGAPLLDMFGSGCIARAGFEANGNILEETVSGAQLSITYENCMPEVFKTNCYIQYSGTITPGTEPPPECSSDPDCSSGFVCAPDGTCVELLPPPECAADTDCETGEVCDTDRICVDLTPPPLCTGVVCPTREGCDSATGLCGPIPCTQDLDCPVSDSWFMLASQPGAMS